MSDADVTFSTQSLQLELRLTAFGARETTACTAFVKHWMTESSAKS
jgi:hypothetical protein